MRGKTERKVDGCKESLGVSNGERDFSNFSKQKETDNFPQIKNQKVKEKTKLGTAIDSKQIIKKKKKKTWIVSYIILSSQLRTSISIFFSLEKKGHSF